MVSIDTMNTRTVLKQGLAVQFENFDFCFHMRFLEKRPKGIFVVFEIGIHVKCATINYVINVALQSKVMFKIFHVLFCM